MGFHRDPQGSQVVTCHQLDDKHGDHSLNRLQKAIPPGRLLSIGAFGPGLADPPGLTYTRNRKQRMGTPWPKGRPPGPMGDPLAQGDLMPVFVLLPRGSERRIEEVQRNHIYPQNVDSGLWIIYKKSLCEEVLTSGGQVYFFFSIVSVHSLMLAFQSQHRRAPLPQVGTPSARVKPLPPGWKWGQWLPQVPHHGWESDTDVTLGAGLEP